MCCIIARFSGSYAPLGRGSTVPSDRRTSVFVTRWMYLDVRQNYVTVHAKGDYTIKRSLNDFEKELDHRFHRVGRSMILNLKYIQRVTKTEVRLSDGTVLPLPRGAYEPLNRAIIQHT